MCRFLQFLFRWINLFVISHNYLINALKRYILKDNIDLAHLKRWWGNVLGIGKYINKGLWSGQSIHKQFGTIKSVLIIAFWFVLPWCIIDNGIKFHVLQISCYKALVIEFPIIETYATLPSRLLCTDKNSAFSPSFTSAFGSGKGRADRLYGVLTGFWEVLSRVERLSRGCERNWEVFERD